LERGAHQADVIRFLVAGAASLRVSFLVQSDAVFGSVEPVAVTISYYAAPRSAMRSATAS
jgi:hypothetical protein